MSFNCIRPFFLFGKTMNSTQNIITEKLLICFFKLSLNFCCKWNRFISLQNALRRRETNKFLRIISSKLLGSNKIILIFIWTSFLSTYSELTSFWRVIDQICNNLDLLTRKKWLDINFCQWVSLIITNHSSKLTKVSYKINTRH